MKRFSGLTFALLALFFWGLAPIFAHAGLDEMSPLIGLSLRTFGIAAVLLAFGITSGEIVKLQELELKSTLLLLGEGIFAGLLGHLAYFYSLKLGDVSRVVPVAMAFPLLTAVIGILLFGESLSLTKAIGIPVIVLGVILLSL